MPFPINNFLDFYISILKYFICMYTRKVSLSIYLYTYCDIMNGLVGSPGDLGGLQVYVVSGSRFRNVLLFMVILYLIEQFGIACGSFGALSFNFKDISARKDFNVIASAIPNRHGKHDDQERCMQLEMSVEKNSRQNCANIIRELKQHEHLELVACTQGKGSPLNQTLLAIPIIQQPRIRGQAQSLFHLLSSLDHDENEIQRLPYDVHCSRHHHRFLQCHIAIVNQSRKPFVAIRRHNRYAHGGGKFRHPSNSVRNQSWKYVNEN